MHAGLIRDLAGERSEVMAPEGRAEQELVEGFGTKTLLLTPRAVDDDRLGCGSHLEAELEGAHPDVRDYDAVLGDHRVRIPVTGDVFVVFDQRLQTSCRSV